MSLRFEDYEIPSAKLGKLNPLPDISAVQDTHSNIDIDAATVTLDESKYMGWAKVNSILPYLIQDGYDRNKKIKKWHAAILENEYIKAIFLPQLGGRLWSLYDKKAGRELLHKNPVFQPCNLALRNAWFSGGVEWNCGIIGHTPYTCDRMYCEQVSLADGTPVVRMYQYERVRGLIYRVEAFLPEQSDRLFVRVRIDNARKKPTAVYWWSNMAVDEREDVRVIVPATKAFRFGYGGKLKKIPVPEMDGMDVSYTMQLPQAMDFFFDLDADKRQGAHQRRWISAIGGDGYGFTQTSTDVLQGRKLFVWGMGAGGRNWQTFLSKKGSQYLEIQAGLAHTQLEHLPMAPGATLSWLEAYGPIRVDAEKTHSADWQSAYEEVERQLEKACPRAEVEEWLERCERELDGQQGSMKQLGMGWARLEQEALDEEFDCCGLRFPMKSLKQAEKQWMLLIERGVMPEPHPLDAPLGYEIGEHWAERLQRSIARGGGHWYCYYQLGVISAASGDMADARENFEKSLEKARNPWALRCLAVLDKMAGNREGAADRMLEAVAMAPEYHIALEAMRVLKELGRNMAVLDVYNNLPHVVRERGRIKVAYCQALIEVGMYARAEEILMGDIELTDVREGEVMLSDLWFSLCAHKEARTRGIDYSSELLDEVTKTVQVPDKLDFRMK